MSTPKETAEQVVIQHPSLIALHDFFTTESKGTPQERAQRVQQILPHVRLLDRLINASGNSGMIEAFETTKKLLLQFNVPIWKH